MKYPGPDTEFIPVPSGCEVGFGPLIRIWNTVRYDQMGNFVMTEPKLLIHERFWDEIYPPEPDVIVG